MIHLLIFKNIFKGLMCDWSLINLQSVIRRPVLISEKDNLFESEDAQILIYLLFYVPYKYHILIRKKGIPI